MKIKHLVLVLFLVSLNFFGQKQIIPDFGARFESFKENIKSPFDKINGIVTDGSLIYIATDRGLKTLNKDGSTSNWGETGENTNYNITDIYIDDQNIVWMGTRISKLLKLPTDKKLQSISLTNPDGKSFLINGIHRSDDKVWFATSKGSTISYDTGTKKRYNLDSSYKGSVNDVYSENGKVILVARDNGLFYRPSGGKNWKQIQNVKKADKIKKIGDTFWIMGTNLNDTPLLLYSKDRRNWINFNNELSCIAKSNIIYNDFDIDSNGRNIWIATSNGLLQYNFELDFCNWFYHDKYPNMPKREINTVMAQNDSTFWMGTQNGELFRLEIFPEEYEEELVEEKYEIVEEKAQFLALERMKKKAKDEADGMVLNNKDRSTLSRIDGEPVEEEPEVVIKKEVIKKKKSLVDITDIVCGETLELSNLLFRASEAEFINTSAAEEYLDILVEYLRQNPNHTIELYGHTDFLSDNKEYLVDLSQQRVDLATKYLSKKGVKEYRIQTQAYGGEFPIVTDRTSKGRSVNRRVEVLINCN